MVITIFVFHFTELTQKFMDLSATHKHGLSTPEYHLQQNKWYPKGVYLPIVYSSTCTRTHSVTQCTPEIFEISTLKYEIIFYFSDLNTRIIK